MKKSASLLALLTLTLLPEISKKIIAAKVLAVFTGIKAKANCFGGASPPSPDRGAERDRTENKAVQKTQKWSKKQMIKTASLPIPCPRITAILYVVISVASEKVY